MDKAEDGVKKDGASPANVTADDKGVPWENRAKEFERKYQEMASKLSEIEARQNSQVQAQESEVDPAEEKRKRLAEFVDDPDAYIEKHLSGRDYQRRIPEAEQWVKSQPGFQEGDDIKLANIIRENELRHNDPMLTARTAWNLLKAERLEKEFADIKREDKVGQSRSEGVGRAQAVKDGPKRSDLVAKLREASRIGDPRAEAALLNMLEDVRE